MGIKNIRSRLSVLRGEIDVSNGQPGIKYQMKFQTSV